MNIQIIKATGQTSPQSQNPKVPEPVQTIDIADEFSRIIADSRNPAWQVFSKQTPILERARKSLFGNEAALKAIALKRSLLACYMNIEGTWDNRTFSLGRKETYSAFYRKRIDELSKELEILFESNPSLEKLIDAEIAKTKTKTEIEQEKK